MGFITRLLRPRERRTLDDVLCPRCGAQAPGEAIDCPACGWDLRESPRD